MYRRIVKIQNPTGLHARPASDFVHAAAGFSSRISVRRAGDDTAAWANAKSIIMLLALGLGPGTAVELAAEGDDEQQAVETLAALIEGGFGEAAL